MLMQGINRIAVCVVDRGSHISPLRKISHAKCRRNKNHKIKIFLFGFGYAGLGIIQPVRITMQDGISGLVTFITPYSQIYPHRDIAAPRQYGRTARFVKRPDRQ